MKGNILAGGWVRASPPVYITKGGTRNKVMRAHTGLQGYGGHTLGWDGGEVVSRVARFLVFYGFRGTARENDIEDKYTRPHWRRLMRRGDKCPGIDQKRDATRP